MFNQTSQKAPVQFIAISFESSELNEQTKHILSNIERDNVIKVLDILIAQSQSNKLGYELWQRSLEIITNESFIRAYPQADGHIIKNILGFEEEELHIDEDEIKASIFADVEYDYGMGTEDLEAVLESIPETGIVVFVLVQHNWMIPLKNVIKSSGGQLISQDILGPEIQLIIGT